MRNNPEIPRRQGVAIAVLALLMFSLAGCGRGEPPRDASTPGSPTNRRPLIVASFYPLHDLARQIAGGEATVVCLVPPGGDPHHEEPSPATARALAEGDAVLLLGLGFDDRFEAMVPADRKARVHRLGGDLGARPEKPGALTELAGTSGANPGFDPHVWLDPIRAKALVRRIGEILVLAVPEHSVVLRERTTRLEQELESLHRAFEEGLAAVPSRRVVTFHGAYAYLFERYRLETVAVVEPHPGEEPGAAYLRGLVDLVRGTGLRVVFAEPQLPDRPARVLADELGARIEHLDPCETVLPDAPLATYQDRQRTNLATLVRVLSDP